MRQLLGIRETKAHRNQHGEVANNFSVNILKRRLKGLYLTGGSRLTSQRGSNDGNQRDGAKHNTFTKTLRIKTNG